MTRDEVAAAVLRALGEIAPEADPASIEPDAALRDQLDLDSMDMLNFAIALHTTFGIEIPESDYPKFATLSSAVDYVLAAAARAAS